MAWTTTKVEQFNTGNVACQLWELTADSATVELDTALDVIRSAVLSPASIGTANTKYGINALSAGTASNGYIAITGAASGDEFYLTVYGR